MIAVIFEADTVRYSLFTASALRTFCEIIHRKDKIRPSYGSVTSADLTQSLQTGLFSYKREIRMEVEGQKEKMARDVKGCDRARKSIELNS